MGKVLPLEEELQVFKGRKDAAADRGAESRREPRTVRRQDGRRKRIPRRQHRASVHTGGQGLGQFTDDPFGDEPDMNVPAADAAPHHSLGALEIGGEALMHLQGRLVVRDRGVGIAAAIGHELREGYLLPVQVVQGIVLRIGLGCAGGVRGPGEFRLVAEHVVFKLLDIRKSLALDRSDPHEIPADIGLKIPLKSVSDQIAELPGVPEIAPQGG